MFSKISASRDLFFKNKGLAILVFAMTTLTALLIILTLDISLEVYQGRQALVPLVKQNVRTSQEIDDSRLDNENLNVAPRAATRHSRQLFGYINNHFQYGIAWNLPAADKNIDLWTVNQNYADLMRINAVSGRGLTQSDFTHKSNYASVLIGSGLRKDYRLGHIYRFRDENDRLRKFKVVGVMKRSADIQNLFILTYGIDLSKAIIRPLTLFDQHHLTYDQLSAGLTQGMLVFGKNKSHTDKIIKKAKQLKVIKLIFPTMKHTVQSYMASFRPAEMTLIGLIIILLLGTGALVAWHTARGLTKLRPEIEARLFSGLSRRQLLWDMWRSQIGVIIVSWLIAVTWLVIHNLALLQGNGINFWSVGFLGFRTVGWLSLVLTLILLIIFDMSGVYVTYRLKVKRGDLK